MIVAAADTINPREAANCFQSLSVSKYRLTLYASEKRYRVNESQLRKNASDCCHNRACRTCDLQADKRRCIHCQRIGRHLRYRNNIRKYFFSIHPAFTTTSSWIEGVTAYPPPILTRPIFKNVKIILKEFPFVTSASYVNPGYKARSILPESAPHLHQK